MSTTLDLTMISHKMQLRELVRGRLVLGACTTQPAPLSAALDSGLDSWILKWNLSLQAYGISQFHSALSPHPHLKQTG